MQSAVIYCRKSDVSAVASDVSFDDQERCCRDWAKQHNYSVYKVYRECHSGADVLNRPMIWDAIDDIRHGDAQVLLVRNWDRLARKAEHSAVIRYEVKEKAGGRIESALDPNDEDDSLSARILEIVADAERANSVRRMVRGTRNRAKRGQLMAAAVPLFGYDWAPDEDRERKKTSYVIDPVSGPIVQRMFKLILAGQSLHNIARLFNAEGVPTPSQVSQERGHGVGKGDHNGRHVAMFWQASLVARIVREPTYTGTATAYRWKRTGKYEKGHVATSLDDPNRLTLTVPALIDQATYDAAQSILSARITAGRPPRDAETSWLRGHVYCGICGSRMVIQHHKGRADEFKCWRRGSTNESAAGCTEGSISARLLNKPVYEALTYLLIRREWATELMVQRLGTGKVQAIAAMAESYQAQIAEKRDELDGAMRMSRTTKDPELAATFLHDAETVNAKIHELETEYAAARDELDNFHAGQAWIQSTMEGIAAHNPIREIPTPQDIMAFPLEERRTLLDASGLRAEVYPTNWTGERKKGYSVGPRVEVSRGLHGEWVEKTIPVAEAPRRVEVFFDWALDQKKSATVLRSYHLLRRLP